MVDFARSLELKLDALISKYESAHVEVGFLENHTNLKGVNYAKIAFWNEFGTKSKGGYGVWVSFMVNGRRVTMPHKGMPARPFFRTTIEQEKGTWVDKIARGLKADKFTSEQVLDMVGIDFKGKLQESIQGWSEPANAPLTIEKKGFNKPLVDTGAMWQTAIEVVTHSGLGDD